MHVRLCASLGLLILITGCGSKTPTPSTRPDLQPGHSLLPANDALAHLKAQLGKEVTVEGIAAEAKLGPMVISDTLSIWIDLPQWDANVRGKRVRVTGTVIERADMPVFIAEPDKPAISGIPVPKGTDLKEAAKRLLLSRVKWELIETKKDQPKS